MTHHRRSAVAVTGAGLATAVVLTGATASADTGATPEPAEHTATVERVYDDVWDADQGIAVDGEHIYAVDNSEITRIDRATGEPELQFVGDEDGPVEHLDSGVVVDSRLYAAHSNYPEWPMESSIEVFDTETMEHVDTHSFGIHRGSLTWIDRNDGFWWATFANYDRRRDDARNEPYGETYNTQVVQLDDEFRELQSWTIPKEILDRFEDMSNSGGSWGPDGNLYITGHDLPEAYVLALPEAGSELSWLGTVALEGIEGQGIAWDRSETGEPTMFGISRDNDEVREYSVPVEQIAAPPEPRWDVVGPEDFVR
ncbi:hypothetical protein [Georgenia deserti]|uniref:WD40 repeat domain-containing protein n=1 Tax=Georgenia deserti TaxID=2093781 RepID=A0ABW4L6P4_9MICO